MINLTSWLGITFRKNRTRFFFALFLFFSLASAVYFHFKFDLLDFEKLQYDAGALDTAFDWRLRAPQVDDRFLIIEIDEASLAYFSSIYGRWPWPRYVFAEALAGISSYDPRSITFNIMFSDPDGQDPNSDAIFNSIIEEVDNVIFPATRLSKHNDLLSQVFVSQLPFATHINEDQTIAILLTLFKGAEEKMGINNLLIDDDGIIRRYSSLYREPNFSLETIPSKIGEIESRPLSSNEYLINWPESVNEYVSLSFKDVYQALEVGDETLLQTLSGKHLILGLTAPGLSFQRPTPVSPFTDDNRLLASISDNIVNGNGLETIPPLAVLLLSIFLFGTLSLCYISKISDDLVHSIFVGIELLSIIITIGSISYTNYAIDLSFIIFVGLIYFGFCHAYDIPVKSSERAHRRFFNDKLWSKYQYFSVIIYEAGNTQTILSALDLKSSADERIFLVDNFLSSGSLFQEEIVDTEVMVYLHQETLSEPEIPHMLLGQFNSLVTDDIQAKTLRVIVNLYREILGPIETA